MRKYIFGICLGTIAIGSWIFFSSIQDKKEVVLSEISENKEDLISTNTKKVIPLENWEGGVITGITEENIYTDIIQSGSVYGEVEKSEDKSEGEFIVTNVKGID